MTDLAMAQIPAVEPSRMRSVLGSYCTGVTAITAMTAAGPVGFTCQSFHSLSLEPPLIVVLPSRTSSTWPAIAEVGVFCVNVLAADQAKLSNQFAASGTDKFAGVDWVPSPNGSPIIDGVTAWIECSIEESFDGGDHHIVVGRVTDLDATPVGEPLLFHRGAYIRVAD